MQYIICLFYHTLLVIKIFVLFLAKYICDYFNLISSSKPFIDDTLTKANFTKLPYHIAFLIIDEQPSYIDLSKLVIWSICFQIYRISLFDPKGIVKKNLEPLKNEIKAYLASFCAKNSYEIYYKILGHSNETYPQKNGVNHKIEIYIVDSIDGQQSLNILCQTLCLYMKKGNFKSNTITTEMFIDGMHKICPEPNLAIKFGSSDCVAGYLPWHLRFTEIISKPTHKHLVLQDYVEYLSHYSRCQQNFGT